MLRSKRSVSMAAAVATWQNLLKFQVIGCVRGPLQELLSDLGRIEHSRKTVDEKSREILQLKAQFIHDNFTLSDEKRSVVVLFEEALHKAVKEQVSKMLWLQTNLQQTLKTILSSRDFLLEQSKAGFCGEEAQSNLAKMEKLLSDLRQEICGPEEEEDDVVVVGDPEKELEQRIALLKEWEKEPAKVLEEPTLAAPSLEI